MPWIYDFHTIKDCSYIFLEMDLTPIQPAFGKLPEKLLLNTLDKLYVCSRSVEPFTIKVIFYGEDSDTISTEFHFSELWEIKSISITDLQTRKNFKFLALGVSVDRVAGFALSITCEDAIFNLSEGYKTTIDECTIREVYDTDVKLEEMKNERKTVTVFQ